MKKLSIVTGGLFLSATLLLASCGGNSHKTDPAESANKQNEMKTEDNTSMEKAADFLVKAADGNLLEVEMGKLAAAKAQMKDVKDFGKMMEEHHGKMLAEVKELAGKKNITLATSLSNDAQKKVEDMSQVEPKKFDGKYIDAMIDDHKHDISAFEDVAKDEKCDADARALAEKALPIMKSHLTLIEDLKKKHDMHN